ncbi:hypothetical protein IBA8403_31330 [Pseudomonas syringae]
MQVRSWTGKGSVFSVRVPLAAPQAAVPATLPDVSRPALNGTQVLCVDNEDSILIGMHSLLSRWGCQVWTARNRQECEALLNNGIRPQIALVDYHLDEGETGTELMAWLRTRLGQPVPGVLISADGRAELIAQVHAAGLDYLPKPVKPAALRALLSRHVSLDG